ncbi:MAG: type II secretion system protein GspD [Proteobacteria bacterium]|nr:type II secretion system protein GspD [Pseudomonadota bacterium]
MSIIVENIILKKSVKGYASIGLIPFIIICLVMALPCSAEELPENKANLNFVDTNLKVVVRAIGKFTGKTFIFDPRVKGKINLVSETPVTKKEAYSLLALSLKLRGFALMQAEGYVMVIPEADGKRHSSVDTVTSEITGQITTKIYRLENEIASSLIPVLKPLVTPNNVITASDSNNSLVITDYEENQSRLQRIITLLDTPKNQENIQVVAIKNAVASELVTIADRILNESNGNPNAKSVDRVLFMADRRTNSIILKSSSKKRILLAESLINKLDQPLNTSSNVHLVHLKNADSVQLAQVLRSVATRTVLPDSNNNNATYTSSAANSSPQAIDSGAGGFIQADPTTNTLIIAANEDTYRSLRMIIDQLDSRRAQVYVESLIVEVSADKAEAFGIQWAGVSGTSTSDVRIGLLAGVSDNLINSAGSAILNLSESTDVSGLTGLAAALENVAKANILSMPNLITLDNEEAKIMVGKNVPFITGQFSATNSSAGVNPFQTIERKDVGLSLQIRPQISEGGTVKMAIYQETSSIQETTTSGLITNKRSLETHVLVNDGDIIVLGGLIEDTISDTVQKIPLLGDLPIFGRLFQFQSKARAKTNLMVFIRPTVLRTAIESSALTADRYDYIGATNPDVSFEEYPILPQLPGDDNDTLMNSLPNTINFTRKRFKPIKQNAAGDEASDNMEEE